MQAQKTARVYDEHLRAEIEADRAAHRKKPLKDDGHDDDANVDPKTGGSHIDHGS